LAIKAAAQAVAAAEATEDAPERVDQSAGSQAQSSEGGKTDEEMQDLIDNEADPAPNKAEKKVI